MFSYELLPDGAIRLASPNLTAIVSRTRGGELQSLESNGVELLHRATDLGPPTEIDGGWQGRAPVLFPAVGRNYTDEQLASAEKPRECRYVPHHPSTSACPPWAAVP